MENILLQDFVASEKETVAVSAVKPLQVTFLLDGAIQKFYSSFDKCFNSSGNYAEK